MFYNKINYFKRGIKDEYVDPGLPKNLKTYSKATISKQLTNFGIWRIINGIDKKYPVIFILSLTALLFQYFFLHSFYDDNNCKITSKRTI